MKTSKKTTEKTPAPRGIHRLLHCVELLQQTLEVKLEALYIYPSFLQSALRQSASQSAMRELTKTGETIVRHMATLDHLLSNLGGAAHDMVPYHWAPPQEPVSAFVFQEELAIQILEECQKMLHTDWDASSQLRAWLEERIETLLKESRDHLVLLDSVFSSAQPRYRDLVLERFRVTAIP